MDIATIRIMIPVRIFDKGSMSIEENLSLGMSLRNTASPADAIASINALI